jgi:hypothetical protein
VQRDVAGAGDHLTCRRHRRGVGDVDQPTLQRREHCDHHPDDDGEHDRDGQPASYPCHHTMVGA